MEFKLHNHDRLLESKLDKIKKDSKISSVNKEIIFRYIRESKLGKTIRKGQKKEISAGRNLQVAGYLMMMCKDWFKKDLDKVTQKDMEKFILDLNQGKIKTSSRVKKKRRPYSSATKSNIKKFIRKFYKWLLTDNKHYPELVEWIDTTKKESRVEAIKGLKTGVLRIVELIPDIRRKALVYSTFDSGFRQGEILSCKIKDLEKREDNIYYLTCPTSKTRVRTVSLPYSSELVSRWLELHPDKDNPDASLWNTSRVMLYKTVKLYGKKALKQNVTVHMLRHTSATFWAPKLDRTTFCKRFGWSYNSPSPDRYIDFAKVHQNKVVELVKSEEHTKLMATIDDLKADKVQMWDAYGDLEEKFSKQTDMILHLMGLIVKEFKDKIPKDELEKLNL